MALTMGQKLFANDAERDAEIAAILASGNPNQMPAAWFDVKQTNTDADPNYPVQLIVGDDPHHRGDLTEKSPSLASFCGDAYAEISPELAEKLDVQDGDAVRIESKIDKLIAPVRVSQILDGDVVFVPRNFSASRVNALLSRKVRIDWVRLNKVSN